MHWSCLVKRFSVQSDKDLERVIHAFSTVGGTDSFLPLVLLLLQLLLLRGIERCGSSSSRIGGSACLARVGEGATERLLG